MVEENEVEIKINKAKITDLGNLKVCININTKHKGIRYSNNSTITLRPNLRQDLHKKIIKCSLFGNCGK